MDITGIIKEIGETQVVSEKFKKRDFVVTDNSTQYPQHILFQIAQDKVVFLDAWEVGDEIKVHFNLRGREWTSPQGELKHFNTLEAWRLEGQGSASKPVDKKEEPAAPETFTAAAEGDDLPF